MAQQLATAQQSTMAHHLSRLRRSGGKDGNLGGNLGDFGNYDHDGRSSGSRNETSTMIVSNNFHSKKHVFLYLPLPPCTIEVTVVVPVAFPRLISAPAMFVGGS